ncbi:adenosylcobinamide-GDP ribazoletransferase [Winogradskya consettensis]|uniref:Adenosylcobinamide-GDP ribazoletransferase n=1 Tax=Winogradskya consettensis TaxID=113560 RepID=A0A919T4J3_9ACTN|nr:adenosylcobinamide-GDP ribazoletransferase [Actinoplanes consettensis]GIM84027.1 adenosylcobinamide-GDP ribazoletransferase [Actinoplanes consettensis]
MTRIGSARAVITTLIDSVRLAVTTLTVLPVRAGRIDRGTAAGAMALAPLIGALLGLVLGGLHALLPQTLLGAALTVTAGVLLTRGLHLDGLADSVDALGSYQKGPKALEIMKKADIGPFGVAAIVLILLLQASALTGNSVNIWAIVTAWATGRLGISIACRKGVPAARPEGLGALVAGTVPYPVIAIAALLIGAMATAAVPGTLWAGPAVVAAVIAATFLLLKHATRRFGGITGDVLGATTELATTATIVALALVS